MKADDLKTKTPDELVKILIDLKKQQFNLRFQASQGQLSQPAQIRAVRRDIARVKTYMNVKEGTAPTGGSKPKAEKKAPAAKAAAKEKKPAAKKTKAA